MKEILISSFIIIAIVLGDFYTGIITRNSVENLNESFMRIREYVDEENEQLIKNEIESLSNLWKESKEKLSFYIEHNEIEKVETELVALKSRYRYKIL